MSSVEYTHPRDSSAMMLIPAGPFLMGSNHGESYEGPQREIYLVAYYIDKYPVTNVQYARFVAETGYRPEGRWPQAYSRVWGDQHPAVLVTWRDADAYARWAGKRLASEAEWEKAARGTDGRRYPWGNRWDARKCCCWEGGARCVQPVGAFPTDVSPFGVCDMAGNVSDWLADWMHVDGYQKWPARNPRGPASGTDRAGRGGNWFYTEPSEFTCFCRGCQNPIGNHETLGFRCVLRIVDS